MKPLSIQYFLFSDCGFSFNPDPTERVSFWAAVIGGGINALPVFVASQICVQRFMTAKSLKESQK